MQTYSPYRLALSAPAPATGEGSLKSRSLTAIPGATIRAISVAAVLACGAGASMAGDATLHITSFTVSAAEFSGTFAWSDEMFPSQLYNLSAKEAGGIVGEKVDNFSADNWNLGANRLAQTTNTKATGNTINFTDPATQLTTAGFNLAAQATGAYSPPAQPNYANASAVQSGAFMLLDDDGNSTGGTITFDLFYDMSVATPGSTLATYSQTQLNLLLSPDGGTSQSFADGLLSNDLTNGTGAITSGHYSWTYTLTAGQEVFYALSGSAIASAELAVAAVPEPETYALMLLGLAGIGTVARRRRSPAAPDIAARLRRHTRRIPPGSPTPRSRGAFSLAR